MSYAIESIKRLNGEISSNLTKFYSLDLKERCIAAGLIFGVAAMTISADVSFVNPKLSSLLLNSAKIVESGLLIDLLVTRFDKGFKVKNIDVLTHKQLRNIAVACESAFESMRNGVISEQLLEVLDQGRELWDMNRAIGRDKQVKDDILANFG